MLVPKEDPKVWVKLGANVAACMGERLEAASVVVAKVEDFQAAVTAVETVREAPAEELPVASGKEIREAVEVRAVAPAEADNWVATKVAMGVGMAR